MRSGMWRSCIQGFYCLDHTWVAWAQLRPLLQPGGQAQIYTMLAAALDRVQASSDATDLPEAALALPGIGQRLAAHGLNFALSKLPRHLLGRSSLQVVLGGVCVTDMAHDGAC